MNSRIHWHLDSKEQGFHIQKFLEFYSYQSLESKTEITTKLVRAIPTSRPQSASLALIIQPSIPPQHVHPRTPRPSALIPPISTNQQQTKIADLVQIHPSDLERGHAQVIEDNINAKYGNKVIQKIGLCICMYDLLSASDGLIGNGDGLVSVNGT